MATISKKKRKNERKLEFQKPPSPQSRPCFDAGRTLDRRTPWICRAFRTREDWRRRHSAHPIRPSTVYTQTSPSYLFISQSFLLDLHILHHRRGYASARIQVQHAVLRPISVMNVQIHDRDPRKPRVSRPRVRRADRHIVQQAEALRHRRVVRVFHRPVGPDVVSRRPDHAEHVPDFRARHRGLVELVHRRADRLRRAPRLQKALRADRRVDVQRDQAVFLLDEPARPGKPSISGTRRRVSSRS